LNGADQPNRSYDVTQEIKERQGGEDRPFRWQENLFDVLVGSYTHNPSKRNWAGSDLGGGKQIPPGGIGDVTVPGTDPLDRISKKHDIQFWLSENFETGCEVQVQIGSEKLFRVRRQSLVNLEAIIGYIAAALCPQRRG